MKQIRAVAYYFVLVVAIAICLFQSLIYSLYAYDCISGSGDTMFSMPVLVYSSLVVVYYMVALTLLVKNIYRKQYKAVMIVSAAVFLFVIAQLLFEARFDIVGQIYRAGTESGP